MIEFVPLLEASTIPPKILFNATFTAKIGHSEKKLAVTMAIWQHWNVLQVPVFVYETSNKTSIPGTDRWHRDYPLRMSPEIPRSDLWPVSRLPHASLPAHSVQKRFRSAAEPEPKHHAAPTLKFRLFRFERWQNKQCMKQFLVFKFKFTINKHLVR
jgi:hypothetical protein